MTQRSVRFCLLAAVLLLTGCSCRAERQTTGSAPVSGVEVLRSWPHDPDAFTQGLVYRDGHLYEGTGLHARSSLREVELETGEVLRQVDLDSEYFGEGVALLHGKLYQLTWRSHVGFIYDATTFTREGRFDYTTEGWGLTEDGTSLIQSDGTSVLRFRDPATFQVQRTVLVTDAGREVPRLNELEYIHGEIYANVWGSDWIARIDPATGHVNAWLDLSGLLPPEERTGDEDVLNGIAYDAQHDWLLVTGKLWPRLFALRVPTP